MTEMEKKNKILAFLDVETTGLSASYDDRICEIGILRASGHKVLSKFESLVNPGRPVTFGALAVHHITDEMLSTAPTFAEISSKVMEILDGAVVICHNAPFDLSFLSHELGLCGIAMPDFETADTLKIARRYFDFPSNSLGNICDYIGVEMDARHRALADAEATFKIFLHMRSELESKGMSDVNKLFTPMPCLNVEMMKKRIIAIPEVLEEALKNKSKLSIRYISASGNETCRIILPTQVLSRQDAIYLVAYCDLRSGERTFRLDRIVEMKNAV
jgi:DNA polymerase-3 subunit epsilon